MDALAEALPGGLLGRAQSCPDSRPGIAGREYGSNASRSSCSAASTPFLAAVILRNWLASRRLSGDTASRPVSSFLLFNLIFITALQRVVRTWGVTGPRG